LSSQHTVESSYSKKRAKNGLHRARSFCQGKLIFLEDELLGKVKIPRTDEGYDIELEEGKNLRIAIDMNETSHTELILSIDDKTSSGKVEFNLVKGC
jgi:hypothetical protein